MKKRHILSAFPHPGSGAILGLTLISLLTVGAHAAATAHHALLPGDDLDLSVPCAQAHLKVDPTLKTGIALEDNTGSALTVQNVKDGAEDQLHITLRNCSSSNRLSLRLAPGTGLTLHDSPHATIVVTGTLSTLDSSLSDASLQLEHIQSLDLSIHGTASVQIHQLDRAAQIVAGDQAQLTVDQAFLSALSAELTGASQLTIEQGQIDSLTLSVANEAVAQVMAHMGTATVSTTDNAILTLGQVSGTLNRSGSGRIQQTQAPTAPTPAPAQSAPPTLPRANTTDGSAQGLGGPPALSPPAKTASTPHTEHHPAHRDTGSTTTTPPTTQATGASHP